MIVRSNIITRATIGTAAREAGVNFINTNARDGWFEPIREFKPRSFEYGFEFFLTGSSPYAAAHQDTVHGGSEKAATWDEWGEVIDRLYFVDPHAQIGHYTSQRDFLLKTRDEAARIKQWHDPKGYQGRSHKAPWLRRRRTELQAAR